MIENIDFDQPTKHPTFKNIQIESKSFINPNETFNVDVNIFDMNMCFFVERIKSNPLNAQ